jgi:hypothetical protein
VVGLALGEHATVAAELEATAVAHPLRESLWMVRSLALAGAGRQADALAVLRALRARLADELTVTPTAIHTRPARDRRPTAVLGVGDPTGPPRLLRVPVDRSGAGYRLEVPDGSAVGPGPASLLVHSHDERLGNLRAVLSVGEVGRDADGWSFRPERRVQVGGEGPLATARSLVRMRRAAGRHLRRRGLNRPAIAWSEFAACAAVRTIDGD